MPGFYRSMTAPGAALSVTIDKYVRVMIHQTNKALQPLESLDKITQEVLGYFNIVQGIKLRSFSEISQYGTGLGASSAYVVGLINCISKLYGHNLTIEALADTACNIEINRCGFPIGKQDSYAAAYGGMNLFEFWHDESVHRLVDFSSDIQDSLQKNLFLVNTGIERDSTKILSTQVIDLDTKHKWVKRNAELAYHATEELLYGNYSNIGHLLNESWQNKKSINKSSTNTKIDELYEILVSHGLAIGGKVLGAGGGGFMLFYVSEENHDYFKLKVQDIKLTITPFKFVNEGSKIIYED